MIMSQRRRRRDRVNRYDSEMESKEHVTERSFRCTVRGAREGAGFAFLARRFADVDRRRREESREGSGAPLFFTFYSFTRG